MAHIDLYVTESFINFLNSVVNTTEKPSARTQQEKKYNPENPVHIQLPIGFPVRGKIGLPGVWILPRFRIHCCPPTPRLYVISSEYGHRHVN